MTVYADILDSTNTPIQSDSKLICPKTGMKAEVFIDNGLYIRTQLGRVVALTPYIAKRWKVCLA